MEHKRDKDFSEYSSVEVKELTNEKLSFNFTWDYGKTCENANKVSLIEGQLVQQYDTQSNIFQKASRGGQTWAIEKWFVKSNKDNPRFTGMPSEDIKSRIEREKVVSADIYNFISNMNPQYKVDIGSFVNDMKPQYQVDIHNFVNNMKPQYQVDIGSFINNMKSQYKVDIGHFVSNMKPQYQVDIGSFVNNMKSQYQVDIGNFVNNMKWIEQ